MIFAASFAVNCYLGIWSIHSPVQVANLFVTPLAWTFQGAWELSTCFSRAACCMLLCVIGGHRWILHGYLNQHPQYYLAGTSFIYNQRQSVAVLCGYLGCIQLAVRALQIYIHRRRDLLQYFIVRNLISLDFGWMRIMVMFNFGVLAVYQAGISHSFFIIIFWVLTFLVLVGISVLTSSRKVFMGSNA
jgi:hypothetical protein